MMVESDESHVCLSLCYSFFGIWTLHFRKYESEFEDGPVVQ
jgi:hypothetical protein